MRGLPRWTLVPAALGALFVVVPLAALVLRVDVAPGPDGTGGLWALITSDEALDALGLSLRTSLTATACCLVLGAPMALVLARTTFPGQRVARSLVLLPLVLPPVVGGIALLYTFGRRGLIGEHLEVLGISIAFSTTAVVMAQTFVALPFLVLSMEGALRTQDTRFEDVAATLGARPTTVLRRVTLPRVLPALASGSVLAFARALGEFGATITFAGALQGVTQTLPLEIYLQRSADPDAAVALSLVLVVVAVVITAAVHGPGLLGGPTAARTPRRRPRPDGTPAPRDTAPAEVAPWSGEVEPWSGDRAAARPPVALHVRAVVPERGVNVELDVAPGEVVAILGDNGAGKSTLVQVVAGLLDTRTARGSSVVLDGTDVSRAHARERHVAWVSQRPLLFAHLSVEANAAFGPRARGASRGAARELARGALGRVGIVELAGRRATDLSGGQAQRASVARALATDPDVLLLDEPLASLDVGVAQHVRTALHDAQRAQPRTTLLVTHDLLDVLVLADRVVVLEAGRVVEDGPAADVVTRPRSRFAARLAGVNLLAGTLESVDDAVCTLAATGARVVGTAGEPVSVGDPAVAVFEPRAVGVHRTTPEGSPRNAFAVVVTSVEPHGPLVRVWGRPAGGRISDRRPDDGPHLAADLTPRAVVELRLAPGERVWFVVKAAEVGVHRR